MWVEETPRLRQHVTSSGMVMQWMEERSEWVGTALPILKYIPFTITPAQPPYIPPAYGIPDNLSTANFGGRGGL